MYSHRVFQISRVLTLLGVLLLLTTFEFIGILSGMIQKPGPACPTAASKDTSSACGLRFRVLGSLVSTVQALAFRVWN